VSEVTLRQLYDLLKMGPTSANCLPARFVFVQSPEAKARLKPCLAPNNVGETMAAPVTAIVGYDTEFYEKLPQLFPHADARSWFAGNPELIHSTAFRNGSLQGAYLMLAARALGLDCGSHVWLRQRQAGCRFLPGREGEIELPGESRVRGPEQGASAGPRLAFEEACQLA